MIKVRISLSVSAETNGSTSVIFLRWWKLVCMSLLKWHTEFFEAAKNPCASCQGFLPITKTWSNVQLPEHRHLTSALNQFFSNTNVVSWPKQKVQSCLIKKKPKLIPCFAMIIPNLSAGIKQNGALGCTTCYTGRRGWKQSSPTGHTPVVCL